MKRLIDNNRDEHLQPPLKHPRASVKEAFVYLQRVRTAYGKRFQDLVAILKDYESGKLAKATVTARVEDLFKGHKELLVGFNNFLPKQHQIRFHEDVDTVPNNTNFVLQQAIDFFNKVRVRFQGHEDYYQWFLDFFVACRKSSRGAADIYRGVSAILNTHPDLLEEFHKFVADSAEANKYFQKSDSTSSVCDLEVAYKHVNGEEPANKQRHEFCERSIQELDYSNWEKPTPSYYCLPKDHPMCLARKSSELEAQVLNHSLVCFNADFSSQPNRIPKHQQVLLNYEDIRFGFDMLVSSFTSAAKQAEDLLNFINGDEYIQGNPINIKEQFTVRNLRCIKSLYGEQGLDFLCKFPTVALPTIVFRLKDKEEELMKHQSDFDKVCAEVNAEIQKKASKRMRGESWMEKVKDIKRIMQKEHDAIF